MATHDGYCTDDLTVPHGPPISYGPDVPPVIGSDAVQYGEHSLDALPAGKTSQPADAHGLDNGEHRSDETQFLVDDSVIPLREQLLGSLQEVVGEEEFTKLAPNLQELGTDALQRLLAARSGRANAGISDGPTQSAAPVDAGGDVSIREHLLELILRGLGEEEYNRHAPQLAMLCNDSLENLLDGLGVDRRDISHATTGKLVEESSPSPVIPADLIDAVVREPSFTMICKATSQRQRQGESQAQFVGRLTHIHLVNKKLSVLGDILRHHCTQLRVLYLSENHLHSLGQLPTCLESLFLQENEVWEMHSWTHQLPNLAVLNLNENRLSLVHGLNNSTGLQELMLRGQRASGLKFEARTLEVFCRSLKVLDIAQNQIMDLTPLACLSRLQRLDASQNALASVCMVSPVLRNTLDLRHLKLERNPLCAKGRYRDEVVLIAHKLEELDGRNVGAREHIFLQELNQRRQQRDKNKRTPSAPPAMERVPDPIAQMENHMLTGTPNAMPARPDKCDVKKKTSLRRSRSEDRSGIPCDAAVRSLPNASTAQCAIGRFKANSEPTVNHSRLPPLLPAARHKVDAVVAKGGYRQRKIDLA